MTLQEMQAAIQTLGGQISAGWQHVAEVAATAAPEELAAAQGELRTLQARHQALTEAYNAQYAAEAARVAPTGMGAALAQAPGAPQGGNRGILASREYARAFAAAIRGGVTPQTVGSRPELAVLTNALTEIGGTPAGSDGGFLVPEDVDHTIREELRSLNPLATLFTQENVSAPTGWRVMDTAPTTGMTMLTGELQTIPQDDQPKFAKVSYSLDTYGLIIPVSQQLANDEEAGLFAYLARWFARKLVLTQNTLLKALLDTLTGAALSAANPIGGIKTVFNKTLPTAIAAGASVITNQSGFDALDQMLDDTGRPLLQPNPADGTPMIFRSRPVHVFDDSLLANTGNNVPFYIGDFRQFATLFAGEGPQGFEVMSTNVGGTAFTTYSVNVRGIARLDAVKFDAKAAVKRTLDISAPVTP